MRRDRLQRFACYLVRGDFASCVLFVVRGRACPCGPPPRVWPRLRTWRPPPSCGNASALSLFEFLCGLFAFVCYRSIVLNSWVNS